MDLFLGNDFLYLTKNTCTVCVYQKELFLQHWNLNVEPYNRIKHWYTLHKLMRNELENAIAVNINGKTFISLKQIKMFKSSAKASSAPFVCNSMLIDSKTNLTTDIINKWNICQAGQFIWNSFCSIGYFITIAIGFCYKRGKKQNESPFSIWY